MKQYLTVSMKLKYLKLNEHQYKIPRSKLATLNIINTLKCVLLNFILSLYVFPKMETTHANLNNLTTSTNELVLVENPKSQDPNLCQISGSLLQQHYPPGFLKKVQI